MRNVEFAQKKKRSLSRWLRRGLAVPCSCSRRKFSKHSHECFSYSTLKRWLRGLGVDAAGGGGVTLWGGGAARARRANSNNKHDFEDDVRLEEDDVRSYVSPRTLREREKQVLSLLATKVQTGTKVQILTPRRRCRRRCRRRLQWWRRSCSRCSAIRV